MFMAAILDAARGPRFSIPDRSGRLFRHARRHPHRGARPATNKARTDPDTVYAGVYRDGLFRSTDGGLHRARRSMGFRSELIVAMAVNSAHPPKGSTWDFGDYWHRFSAGLDDLRVTGLSFASDGSALHASTDGGGVFER
jgi:hypothetical protein